VNIKTIRFILVSEKIVGITHHKFRSENLSEKRKILPPNLFLPSPVNQNPVSGLSESLQGI
jgi:hypothetical protein